VAVVLSDPTSTVARSPAQGWRDEGVTMGLSVGRDVVLPLLAVLFLLSVGWDWFGAQDAFLAVCQWAGAAYTEVVQAVIAWALRLVGLPT
jgi:hypothetical protein